MHVKNTYPKVTKVSRDRKRMLNIVRWPFLGVAVAAPIINLCVGGPLWCIIVILALLFVWKMILSPDLVELNRISQSIKVTVWTIVGGIALLVVLGTSLWSKYRSLSGTSKKIVTWVGALSLLPVLFICFVHFYFDVFSGLMQSYIFTMLTMMFVSDRIAEDWHAQQ